MILRVVIVSLIADYSEIVNYCANITVGETESGCSGNHDVQAND